MAGEKAASPDYGVQEDGRSEPAGMTLTGDHMGREKIELCCPAGNLPSLKAAIDNGADVVYLGFRNATNARNFEGLNFSHRDIEAGIDYAHRKGKKVFVALNTFPQFEDFAVWFDSVDSVVDMGADAAIIANIGVLKYAADTYPDLRLHLSVQASASSVESLNFYREHFNVRRAVLPRVLTVEEIKEIKTEMGDFELEVFGYGGLCINICGRCYLSSYITGVSCNTGGVCSPSSAVSFENEGEGLKVSLGNVVLNRYSEGEVTSYPTSCKGRYYYNGNELGYPIEEPASLNVLDILPHIIESGADSLKIEGRQRTRSYVATITGIMREAIDRYYDAPGSYYVEDRWTRQTALAMEGMKTTYGSYVQK